MNIIGTMSMVMMIMPVGLNSAAVFAMPGEAVKVENRITKNAGCAWKKKCRVACPGPGACKTNLSFSSGAPMAKLTRRAAENLMLVLIAKSKNVHPVAFVTGVFDGENACGNHYLPTSLDNPEAV